MHEALTLLPFVFSIRSLDFCAQAGLDAMYNRSLYVSPEETSHDSVEKGCGPDAMDKEHVHLESALNALRMFAIEIIHSGMK
jgi:hypothetical protein